MLNTILVIILGVVLTACGGGASTSSGLEDDVPVNNESGNNEPGNNEPGNNLSKFTIGGNIINLQGNIELTLSVNGSVFEVVNFSDSNALMDFIFSSQLEVNTSYQIDITSSPEGQLCLINRNVSGAILDSDVTNVLINCEDITGTGNELSKYTIGGNIMNLQGSIELTLSVNGSLLEVATFSVSNLLFNFNSQLETSSTYQIEVTSSPLGQVCSIDRSVSGVISDNNVTNVLINCEDEEPGEDLSKFTIGGNIINLQGNIELTLSVNGSLLEVKAFPVSNGFFDFNSQLAVNSTYQIEVTSNPQGQVCSIDRGVSGTVPNYNVSNVLINCQDAQYFSIGAFSIPGDVTVQLNQNETKTVSAGTTSISFETPFSVGDPINLEVIQHPQGYECVFNDVGISTVLKDPARHQYEVYCFALNQPVTNIYRSVSGFSAIRSDGSMFVWGAPSLDASSVQRDLMSVIYASDSNTSSTIAAVNQSNNLVSWMAEPAGGEASDVEHLLAAGISGIWKNLSVTSVLTKDGYLVSWGFANYGGGVYQHIGQDFTQVVTNTYAFAALKSDGSVIAWGLSENGGSTSGVTSQLQNVKKLVALGGGFAALTHDGNVITWPEIETSQSVLDRVQSITDITANYNGLLALREDGGLVVMGFITSKFMFIDGNIVSTEDWVHTIENAKAIYSTSQAYAVLREDNTVISFGHDDHGADYRPVESDLVNVKEVYPLGTIGKGSFAALKNDGTVVTWGYNTAAGDSFSVSDQLTNVKRIFSTDEAYAALKEDGSVVTWGNASIGGSSLLVKDELVNVVDIVANPSAFAAIKEDGSVITWGDPSNGGDSSKVAKQLNR